MGFTCLSLPERLHLSKCLFCKVMKYRAESNQLGMRCSCSITVISVTSGLVAHADVNGQSVTAQHCAALNMTSRLVVSLSALTFS